MIAYLNEELLFLFEKDTESSVSNHQAVLTSTHLNVIINTRKNDNDVSN
jgi:hypothetical protein